MTYSTIQTTNNLSPQNTDVEESLYCFLLSAICDLISKCPKDRRKLPPLPHTIFKLLNVQKEELHLFKRKETK